jgi:hypothetical protein
MMEGVMLISIAIMCLHCHSDKVTRNGKKTRGYKIIVAKTAAASLSVSMTALSGEPFYGLKT